MRLTHTCSHGTDEGREITDLGLFLSYGAVLDYGTHRKFLEDLCTYLIQIFVIEFI